jgi:hypothetical protein
MSIFKYRFYNFEVYATDRVQALQKLIDLFNSEPKLWHSYPMPDLLNIEEVRE